MDHFRHFTLSLATLFFMAGCFSLHAPVLALAGLGIFALTQRGPTLKICAILQLGRKGTCISQAESKEDRQKAYRQESGEVRSEL